MKKLIKLLTVFGLSFSIVGCGSKEEHNSVSIDNEDEYKEILEEQEKAENTTDQDEFALIGTVNDYIRHSKEVEGKKVLVNGMWNTNVLNSIDESAFVNLSMNTETKKSVEPIKQYARAYVYGTSKTIDGDPCIEVENVDYINPLTEEYKYWSNSIIIDDTNISQYADYEDPYAEYECYLTRTGDRRYRLIGGYGTIFIDEGSYIQKYELPIGKSIQVLLNDLRFEDRDFRASIVEYVIIDG